MARPPHGGRRPRPRQKKALELWSKVSYRRNVPISITPQDPRESEGTAIAVECFEALINPDDPDFPDEDRAAKRRCAAIMLATAWMTIFDSPRREWEIAEVLAKASGAKVG